MANKSKQHRNKNKVIIKPSNSDKWHGTARTMSLSRTRNSARSKYTPSIEDKKHSLI